MKEQVLYNLECKDVAKAIFGEEILTQTKCVTLCNQLSVGMASLGRSVSGVSGMSTKTQVPIFKYVIRTVAS